MIPINMWLEAILNGLVNAGNSWERDTECCGSSDVNSHFFNLVYPTNSCKQVRLGYLTKIFLVSGSS